MGIKYWKIWPKNKNAMSEELFCLFSFNFDDLLFLLINFKWSYDKFGQSTKYFCKKMFQ